jgi:hypothetical protein
MVDLFDKMLDDFVIMAPSSKPEPTTTKATLSGKESELWQQALKEEFDAIKKIGVYKLIPYNVVPARWQILRGKAAFKHKCNENGNIMRYKVR